MTRSADLSRDATGGVSHGRASATLSRLEALDDDTMPLFEEEIAATREILMSILTRSALAILIGLLLCWALAVVGIVFFSGLGGLVNPSFTPESKQLGPHSQMLLWSLITGAIWGWLQFHVQRAGRALDLYRQFKPLSDSPVGCQELLSLVEADAQCRAYRDRVLEIGDRELLEMDLAIAQRMHDAAVRAAEDQARKKLCREVHGIAS